MQQGKGEPQVKDAPVMKKNVPANGLWQYRPISGFSRDKSGSPEVEAEDCNVALKRHAGVSPDKLGDKQQISMDIQGDRQNGMTGEGGMDSLQTKSAKRIEMQSLDSEQQLLYETLKTWRNHLAMSMGYAPYMVLSNDSLARVACERPDTIELLSKIKGFGEVKMQKYAIPVLALVRGGTVPDVLGGTMPDVLGGKSESRPLQLITPMVDAGDRQIPASVGEGNQVFLPVFSGVGEGNSLFPSMFV